MSKATNIVGIVPVAGNVSNYDMPWHDSLMPISQTCLAVERAVLECGFVGCTSIWIACPESIEPFFRKRMRDCIVDPYEFKRASFVKIFRRSNLKCRILPIFYIYPNMHNTDVNNSQVGILLSAANIIDCVYRRISWFTRPVKFYVAWPYGVYDPSFLSDYRIPLRNNKENMFIRHNGKIALDDEYLGFTFTRVDASRANTVLWNLRSQRNCVEREPPFTISEAFTDLRKENDVFVDIEDYWNINNWEQYCKYMGDTEKHFLKHNLLFPKHKIKGFGEKGQK